MTLPARETERDPMLRDYLLGVLPVHLQVTIDERFVEDGELHAELLATADDLIHGYLAGELSPAERERFESHFLASPRRRERLAFIRSLVTAVDRERGASIPSREPIAASRRAWVPMLPWAAVLVVGLVAGGWAVVEEQRGAQLLASAEARARALQEQIDQQRARIVELESVARATADLGDIATWTLGPGVERGPGGFNAFRVRGSWVRIRVPLEHDLRVDAYRAILHTREGRELLRVGGLREQASSNGRTLDLMVPAGLLPPGSYLLAIERDAAGTSEELTAMTFSVR